MKGDYKMNKEQLNNNLIKALDNFEHQSYQAVSNDPDSFELAKAIHRLMDAFRENLINYLP